MKSVTSIFVIILISSTIVLSCSIGYTDTTCNDVIKACDKALQDKDLLIQAQKTAFDDAIKHLTDCREENLENSKKLDSIWRNPYFLIPVSIALTGLGYEILTHH